MRHRTAKQADWYIPIRPGTDGALALAMMHVIIDEGLVDADHVRDHTVGYDELAERVRQYPPQWAAQETGIPAEDIRTHTREYATSQPSMIRIGVAIERHAGGGQTVRAISANAQSGSCSRPPPTCRHAPNAKDSATANAVNPFRFADLGNASTFSDTRVEIELV